MNADISCDISINQRKWSVLTDIMNSGISSFLKNVILFLLFSCSANAQEEFNGPFKSWANVKTRFGAKGNGKTDDTRALQTALDSLSDRIVSFNVGSRGYAVVYIPAGVYKITNTLVLRGKIGIKIVGEDPANTVLLWQGPENDTLLCANGSAYFSLSRLTWDAGGRKNMEAVGLHWLSVWRTPQNNSYASLNNEFVDLVFREGFAIGISGGTQSEGTNANDSEILIKRCVFNKCTKAGIKIRGYNALDYWIWYCRFIQCNTGVECNSGNYHIYYSYFKQSASADVMNTNSYYTSVRYSYSTGAAIFSLDHGKSSNTFKRIFQANTIINPKQNPIQYFHSGKITLIDNYCKVPATSPVNAFLTYDTWANTLYTVLEAGNLFENFKNVYQMPVKNYKIYKSVSNRKTINSETVFLQQLGTTPPMVKRTVYDIPEGASTSSIQKIIDKAASLQKRAIVHFPFGRYFLEKAIVLNKNCDIQIEGDGMIYSTALIPRKNSQFENGSVFKIYGPSTVSIKDMDIQTKDGQNDNSRAIVVVNADQPGASFLIDQIYAGEDSTIVIKRYDHLILQKTNSFFSAGNYIVGGPGRLSGSGLGKIQCFGAQFAHTSVTGNAYFFASDCWWEGKSRIPLDFTGQGTILIQGAMVAPNGADSNTTVRINNFNGRIGLLDMYIQGGIEINPQNPLLKLMVWNINFYHKRRPIDFLSPLKSYMVFFGGITGQCFDSQDPTCNDFFNTPDRELTSGNTNQFIAEFIDSIRASKPIRYSTKPLGISNIYFSRISISDLFTASIALETKF